MKCPTCREKLMCNDSRRLDEWRWRRYVCKVCDHLFYTKEEITHDKPRSKKSSLEPHPDFETKI
jgi:transcriptional regulator NrdR family protein